MSIPKFLDTHAVYSPFPFVLIQKEQKIKAVCQFGQF
jgi:hypothetical protein